VSCAELTLKQIYSLQGYVKELMSLELGTWHDLAHIYINLSQWRDAESCLSRSRLIAPYSSVRYHIEGITFFSTSI